MTPFQLMILSLDHTNTIFESEFHFVRLETGSGPIQQYEFYKITLRYPPFVLSTSGLHWEVRRYLLLTLSSPVKK